MGRTKTGRPGLAHGQSLPNLQLYHLKLTLYLGHVNMFYPSGVIAYNIRVLQTC